MNTKIIDDAIALRIIYLLAEPIKKTDAFKLGIIDENGKQLKKTSELKTEEEKNAYSYLRRLIFKLKSFAGSIGKSSLLSVGLIMTMLKEDISVDDLTENSFVRLAEDAPTTAIGNVAGLANEPFKGKKSPIVLPYVRRNQQTKLKKVEQC